MDGRGKAETLPGEAIVVSGPWCRDAIHRKRVDVNAGREVISGRPAGSWCAGLMDIYEQLDNRIAERVRAVVEVRDLLVAPNGSVGRESRDRDVVAAPILPVRGSGSAVGRSGSFSERSFDIARHVQRTAACHWDRRGRWSRSASGYEQ